MQVSVERLRLYLVADPDIASGDLVDCIRSAIGGGATCVQLRCKTATDRQLAHLARRVLGICEPHGIPMIVNDRIDIALAVGAHGVHLGIDDLSIEDARRLGGPEFAIGYSPESDFDIAHAAAHGATYLGIGPFASTRTKLDAGSPIGATEFARRRRLTTLPVVAIGGIGVGNARAAIDAGANGVAIASAIFECADPAEAARRVFEATAPDQS
ncbi:MAG: thiamine phosphate synthase [Thermomicrobiales bacterium]